MCIVMIYSTYGIRKSDAVLYSISMSIHPVRKAGTIYLQRFTQNAGEGGITCESASGFCIWQDDTTCVL